MIYHFQNQTIDKTYTAVSLKILPVTETDFNMIKVQEKYYTLHSVQKHKATWLNNATQLHLGSSVVLFIARRWHHLLGYITIKQNIISIV